MGDEKNPGICYEYSVPTSVTTLPGRTQFSWRTDEFDKCSATCAGGMNLWQCILGNTNGAGEGGVNEWSVNALDQALGLRSRPPV